MDENFWQRSIEVTCRDTGWGPSKKKKVYFNFRDNQLVGFNGCEDLNGGPNCKVCEKASLERLMDELKALSQQQPE